MALTITCPICGKRNGYEFRFGGEEKGPRPDEKDLTPEAKRALAEADARRAAEEKAETPKELGGRKGPDPARYGDWEKKGIAVDF